MTRTLDLSVDCRGRSANVEVMGEGEDLVLVGAAVPMAWARPAASLLAQRGFRVVNFDYGSDHEDPLPRTSLDQVADVVSVLDAAEWDGGVVVGLSRGALTAYAFSSQYPQRARGLVLAFPVAGFADTLLAEEAASPSDDDASDSFDLVLESVFSPAYLRDHRDEAVRLLTTAPGSVSRVERSDENPFPEDMAAKCPIVVLEGGADHVVGPEHPARYLEAHPEAEHLVVPNAYHGWLMEEPDSFATIVAEFVGRIG